MESVIHTSIESEVGETGEVYIRVEVHEPTTDTKAVVIMAANGYALAELRRGSAEPYELERIEKVAAR